MLFMFLSETKVDKAEPTAFGQSSSWQLLCPVCAWLEDKQDQGWASAATIYVTAQLRLSSVVKKGRQDAQIQL